MAPHNPSHLSKHLIASKHLLAVRRASTVAEASTSTQCALWGYCDRNYFRLSRQQTELKASVLTTELQFLDLLGEMDKDEKYETMFCLFDKDDSGAVDLPELTEGMRRISHMPKGYDMLPTARRVFRKFDTHPDGQLERAEFRQLLDSLNHALDCSFHDFCCLLVMKISFTESGKTILESRLLQVLEDAKQKGEEKNDTSGANNNDLQELILETRLCLLFDMMDQKQDGLIKFQDVIQHIFRHTKDVAGSDTLKEEVETMLARGQTTSTQPQMMDFGQFCEFVLRVGQAFRSAGIDFNTLANRITLSFCHAVDDADLERRLNLSVNDSQELILEPIADEDKLAINGRLSRLFDLWDVDHNGKLDLGEFFLGMRKFEAASGRSMEDTVDGSLSALYAHDEDDDDQLDRREFANLIQRYADTLEIDIHNLIDYMVVQSALRDVNEDEVKYLEHIKRYQFGGIDDDGEPVNKRATFVRVLRQTTSRLDDAVRPDHQQHRSPTKQRSARSHQRDSFRKNEHNALHVMMARGKQHSPKAKSNNKPWFFQSGESLASH